MKSFASILLLAGVASTTEAFSPPAPPKTHQSTTTLNHIDTRHSQIPQEIGVWEQTCRDHRGNLAPCEALSGHERRAMWETYAPAHGEPSSFGAIGCPGGGDWCYASSYGAAAPIQSNSEVKKRAATVAAALAGLGVGVGGAVSIARNISTAGGSSASEGAAFGSGGADGSVMGEDVREARTSYAPYLHDGRVGSFGEIDAGFGDHATGPAAAPAARRAGPRGGYAIGSWQK